MTLGLPLRKMEKTHAMLQHTRFFRPSAGPRSSPPTRPRHRTQPAPPRASRAPSREERLEPLLLAALHQAGLREALRLVRARGLALVAGGVDDVCAAASVRLS